MKTPCRLLAVAVLAATIPVLAGCDLDPGTQRPRMTLFVGVDASGSFYHSGNYDDSLIFLSHYLYGHMNGLGGLRQPKELFVAAIGGNDSDEPKSFHPIHDFAGKGVEEIEQDLREWFPPTDALTDFNAFFQEVARITKERNLVLAPITVMVVTDGIPDFTVAKARTGSIYEQIDLGPMEYLSRNLTLRLTYVTPKAGQSWRRAVPRQRVRLWTVDSGVMRGWREQITPAADISEQDRLWEWMQANVDYRVRSF